MNECTVLVLRPMEIGGKVLLNTDFMVYTPKPVIAYVSVNYTCTDHPGLLGWGVAHKCLIFECTLFYQWYSYIYFLLTSVTNPSSRTLPSARMLIEFLNGHRTSRQPPHPLSNFVPRPIVTHSTCPSRVEVEHSANLGSPLTNTRRWKRTRKKMRFPQLKTRVKMDQK